jgi:ectoine hydroxylase-related dioxygenase (phytanoyl-CoA dioxygenase family)
MRWHRDYNDQHLVKVFTYLVDVDEGTGPLEYVPGSARGGPYAHEWPWEPMGETYPPGEDFDSRIPDSAVRTFTAPAGSMIFANTSGFHRGGFATEKARSLWVFNYVSPAALHSLVERNFEIGDGALTELSEVERYALT